MMFMIPMPPTSREMLAMVASKMVRIPEVAVAAAAMSVCVRMVKSGSSDGPRLCLAFSTSVISFDALVICGSDLADASML